MYYHDFRIQCRLLENFSKFGIPDNQEDSVIFNKASLERGLFCATSYKTLTDEEKKQGTYNFETICLPPIEIRKRTDSGANIYVEKGDVVIGKILTKSNKNGDEEIFDCSYTIKSGEEGFIDRVIEQGTKLNQPIANKIPTALGKAGGIAFKSDYNYPNEHQLTTTECGIYSLYFIVHMLEDKLTGHYLKTHKIKDKYVEQFRKIYFNEEL